MRFGSFRRHAVPIGGEDHRLAGWQLRPDGDIDVLVDLPPKARPGLLELAAMMRGRVLLVDSSSQHLSESVLPLLRRNHGGQVAVDPVTC